MVWAPITFYGSPKLAFLEGKQNSSKYIETLDQYLFQLCDKFRDDTIIFQHYNALLYVENI